MSLNIVNIIDLTNAPTPPRWFEFLLEPGRLQNHLEKNCCDPSPYQLILSFLRNSPNLENNFDPLQTDKASPTTSLNGESEVHIPPDSYEAKYRIRKAYALQTLAIKVASFLRWDLDAIASHLSLPIQHKLLLALTSACAADSCPKEMKKFSEILYCRWLLRSAITYQLSALQPQSNNTTMIYLSQLQQQQQAAESSALFSMAELFAPDSEQLKTCATALESYFTSLTGTESSKSKSNLFDNIQLSRPKMDCFDHRDAQYNNWKECELTESKEFIEAACYDLGRYFFFRESYGLAKTTLEFISDTNGRFSHLNEYLKSATDLLLDGDVSDMNGKEGPERGRTEKYLFNCMTQFRESQAAKESATEVEEGEIEDDDDFEEDSDLRFERPHSRKLPEDMVWYLQVPNTAQQQILLDAAKGDLFMSQGNFKLAMGCFVSTLMLMTDYFSNFSKDYVDEEPYVSRMIQCSISLSCFTQAVALCQMSKNLNYTIAFKQLNERICNDCCDDIYECIWNVTLLEYIINLHARRGEVERRSKVIQLLGQLELNENNPEEILREAEHVRRSRFFRIMANKYL